MFWARQRLDVMIVSEDFPGQVDGTDMGVRGVKDDQGDQLTSPLFDTDNWGDYGRSGIVCSEKLSHPPTATQGVESCLRSD